MGQDLTGQNLKRREFIVGLTAVLGVSQLSAMQAKAIEAATNFKSGDTPKYFSETQIKIIERIADIIIPDTDTPGAAKAGVHLYIDHMAANWMTDAERSALTAGISKIDSRGFLDLSAGDQVAFVQDLDDRRGEEPAYNTIKEFTVIGYYTSEIGATVELNYDPLPGEFKEIPFSDVGKTWAGK